MDYSDYLQRGYLLKKQRLMHIGVIIGVKDIEGHIVEMYKSGMSCAEIAEKFKKAAPMWAVSGKTISDRIWKWEKINGETVMRNKKDGFINAIERGRMTYKKKENKYRRKGITLKKRYQIMERDGFRCKLCGGKYELEIDHIIPISHGGCNNDENLQTLCWYCNHGKSQLEK